MSNNKNIKGKKMDTNKKEQILHKQSNDKKLVSKQSKDKPVPKPFVIPEKYLTNTIEDIINEQDSCLKKIKETHPFLGRYCIILIP